MMASTPPVPPVDPRPRRIALVPAFNEAQNVADVIREIRRAEPDFAIVVIDDGSTDGTAVSAAAERAVVLRLPFNLGIGAAVQTGYKFAYEHGFDIAVQIDGDGQHDPAQLRVLLAPLLSGLADVAIGSRFSGPRSHIPGRARRMGIRLFATVVSALVARRLTDTTSGFRAVNRRGIRLFAAEYPNDYPEVEAILMAARQRLRLVEVPVLMRPRALGRSSITAPRSLYYLVKVMLAIFIGLFRRDVIPREDQ
jgi:glycosyltransferase involved in cell wall biosynthesis